MSKQVRPTGKNGQSVQSHQPGWMAHWMRTSTNDHTTSEAPRSVQDSGKLEGSTQSVRPSSAGFRNEGMCSAQTSMERCVGVGGSTRVVPYHDLERYRLDKGKAVATPPVKRPSIFSSNQLHDHGEMGAPSMNDQDSHVKDWLQKMQKCSHVISLLPTTKSSDKNERKVPSCLHETMRICTTVAVEAPPRGCPWFSHTTHSLLITKNTDASVSKEADIFRSLVTKMSGNSSSVLECVPPFYSQANRGVTLQPISSSNSEEPSTKYASKNESSAETDTMDMDFSQERANCGANSARSTKVFSFENNPSPRMDAASSREVVGCRWMPEINLELPASSTEDIPTSSRTQSLEMDMLLVQAEQPEPKSNPSPDADPTTRWVKRLKLSSSETSALGSKSSRLAEKLSHDKNRDFFRSILKRGITSKEDEHLPSDQPRKSKELLLSHVWIKRWLRNGSQRKPETPQSLKSPLPKKQFPSIAAMALMGRTMSGFQSCELQKRGSFTIWNTNTL